MSETAPLNRTNEFAHSLREAHPGYELVSFGEVGVPFFELRIRAEVLDHKPIDPFAEFVLRAVEGGVTGMESIGSLLGLEPRVLENTLVSLVTTDALVGASAEDEFTITEEGKAALDTANQFQVLTTELRVAYDPLLARVVEPVGELLQPRELADRGIREIGLPAGMIPEIHDLDVADVETVLRRMGAGREQARDVLALRSPMRRFRVFRPAVAIVYRAKGTTDVIIDIAIGGEVSERHSRALAEHRLKDKLGAKLAGTDRLGPRLAGFSNSKVQPDRSQIQQLGPTELPQLLEMAFDTAGERAIVTSPGLRGEVLDQRLLGKVEAAIGRGISVHIGWGYEEGAAENSDPAVIKELDRLAQQSPNLNVRQLPQRKPRENLLICDDKFLVTTDFRWLSNLGDPRRTFGDERAVKVTDPAFVDERADKILARLTARA